MLLLTIIAKTLQLLCAGEIIYSDSVKMIDNEAMFKATMGSGMDEKKVQKIYKTGIWFK